MIEVDRLSFFYGSFQALHSVSFRIPNGEIAGLLGLNGAGKTTCLRVLTGFLQPTSGDIKIDGDSVFTSARMVKSKIGYLPENPPLYQELTVRDYLMFVARLRGVPRSRFPDELKLTAERTNLTHVLGSLIRNLSLGYRKRVGLAQAIIGSPPVIVLDEPVSGLDPRQIVEIRKLIRGLAQDHTVLLSSHILSEVSLTCDRVFIIHQGHLTGEFSGDDLAHLEDRFMEATQQSNTSGVIP